MNDLELTDRETNRDALKLAAYILRASTICPASRKFAQHVLNYLALECNSTLNPLNDTFGEDKLFMGMQGNCIFYVPDPDSGYPDKPGGGISE